ncbi:MAG: thiamine-monophosphate kinase [Planctomycetaceae bacterium]|nr:thiamine-monophosphate kinase [Planctomycetaceae bacterium]
MESEFVAWLRQRVPPHPLVPLGIGDDAAQIALSSGSCIVTSDMLMEGVDFRLRECEPRQIGRKALAVNLSDLAAMAAKPVAAIISVAVPSRMPITFLKLMYEGLLDLGSEFDVALAGGDTNSWKHPLAISVTAIGEPTGGGLVTRSGAQVGDAILVTGEFGGSILGRHLEFRPRVAEAIYLHRQYEIHAAMDVSDGLSLDLSRLANQSGCGAIVNSLCVPISDDAHRLAAEENFAMSALEHALRDGEDFELILAVSQDTAERILADGSLGVRITRIGEFVSDLGLWQQSESGDKQPLTPRGYEH